MKKRLDVLIVDRGLAGSREKAQRLILAGQVLIDGAPAGKPGRQVRDDVEIALKEQLPFVGRGGLKLVEALDRFEIEIEGRTAIDIGASTGGFTDCLLQRGTAFVIAVDVGKGQLDWGLRNDPRVTVMEGINARYLKPDDLERTPDLCVIDVSFISLTKILPAATQVLAETSDLITLIKPQFEAGREQVGKGGVVKDPEVHKEVIERVRTFGTETLRLTWVDCIPSPIKGPAGNIEFLAHWQMS
ncbi:MAG: TlyA family RNA methyltransferase [Verrucomicrobiota bacterium]